MTPRRVDAAERRARLGLRHHLAGNPAADPVAVARSLVALHATDAATVYLSVAARLADPSVADVERALYDDRTLIRMLGMRRTVFVVPVESAPVVQAAATDAVAAVQRRLLLRHLGEAGLGEEAWLKEVEESTLRALAARGSATAAQLTADEPRLRSKLLAYDGAAPNITSRVLNGLSQQGRIVRGRPRGTWISTQYHWSPVESWLPSGLTGLGADEARATLAEQWLAAYGPATPADLTWWTGWTVRQTTAALAALDTEPVDLNGTPGLVLARDAAPVAAPAPWVALLPALDPTIMGWVGRDWYLGPHGPTLFDRSGNPGPTVWVDGRVVGGWAQRASDGRVVYRLLEKVPAATRAAIDARAAALSAWLEPVVVTPRFRTPLEKELAAS